MIVRTASGPPTPAVSTIDRMTASTVPINGQRPSGIRFNPDSTVIANVSTSTTAAV